MQPYFLLLALIAGAVSCPETCFDATCDTWTSDGYSCDTLSNSWGCDCNGCVCDEPTGDGKGSDDKGASDDKAGDDTAWDDKDGEWDLSDDGVGTWTTEALGDRSYDVYVPAAIPDGGYAGVVLYFHGVGGSSDVKYSYGVGVAADRGGFVGVVPRGSPQAGSVGYEWNVDTTDGVDEVAFVHEVVAAVLAARDVAAGGPVLVQGFSNGAGMVELLGCHSSHNLWVAHLAARYDPAATSLADGTCRIEASPCAEWSAVGENDYFLDQIGGASGILSQFQDLRDALGCPAADAETESGSDGETCYGYPGCDALGSLCVYDGVGHDIVGPGMANRAWDYLSARRCDSATGAPAAFLHETDDQVDEPEVEVSAAARATPQFPAALAAAAVTILTILCTELRAPLEVSHARAP